MPNLRTQIENTKRFVKEHKTLTACAATAVVTARIVRDKDAAALKAISAHVLLLESERFAMLLDATAFIDRKGLTEEFYETASRRIRD